MYLDGNLYRVDTEFTWWITKEISHIKFHVSINSFTIVNRPRAHDRKFYVLIWAEAEIFLTSTVSRVALTSISLCIGWISNHTPQSCADTKNSVCCTSTTHYVFMAWCVIKRCDIFSFYFSTSKRRYVFSLVFSLMLIFNCSKHNLDCTQT
jgi:hypothetical protein